MSIMKQIIIIVLAVMSLNIHAQDNINNELSVSGGAMTGIAQYIRLAYIHYINKCLGQGGGVGVYKQWDNEYLPQGDIKSGKWSGWELNEKDNKMEKLYIEPTLSFKTPALIHLGSWEMGLQAEPGIMIQIPYTFVDVDYIDRNTSVPYEKGRSAHASDWCFWDLRTMLRFSSKDAFIAVGYGISNLDIYSSCRSMSVEGTSFNSIYPSKKIEPFYIYKSWFYYLTLSSYLSLHLLHVSFIYARLGYLAWGVFMEFIIFRTTLSNVL